MTQNDSGERVFDSFADAVEYLVFHGDGQSRIEPFKDGEVTKYRVVK